MFGICRYSTVCVKREPSHTSELVTELLFNDIYETIENQDDWIKIRMEYDGYEGWISTKQHQEIPEEEFKTLISKEKSVICDPVEILDGKILTFGTTIFRESNPISGKADEMISNGLKLLDVPYRWGGRTVFGIDCSGFVQLCAKSVGIKMPRDASQQVKHGDDVYFLAESKPGDIAFFENEEYHIVHVGIIIEGERILHASGKVRIDSLDQTGIFNKEAGRHTHFLAAIKRVIKQDVEK